jgi:uncharacterized protein YlxW (UPF0749 family)
LNRSLKVGCFDRAVAGNRLPMVLSGNFRNFHTVSKDSVPGDALLSADMRRTSSLLAVCLTLAMASAAFPQTRKPQQSRSTNAKTANHAKIVAAINSLEAARNELQHSEKDFGGHKQDALDAVNNALKQLRLALQFEKY